MVVVVKTCEKCKGLFDEDEIVTAEWIMPNSSEIYPKLFRFSLCPTCFIEDEERARTYHVGHLLMSNPKFRVSNE